VFGTKATISAAAVRQILDTFPSNKPIHHTQLRKVIHAF
jgi:hypothetical protein